MLDDQPIALGHVILLHFGKFDVAFLGRQVAEKFVEGLSGLLKVVHFYLLICFSCSVCSVLFVLEVMFFAAGLCVLMKCPTSTVQ